MTSILGLEEESSPSRKKTVLRTLRLPEALSKQLEDAASEDGVSFNSLTATILLDYVEWNRKAKKFGFTYISKDLMKVLLQSAEPSMLDSTVRVKYAGVLKDMAMYWYQDASLPSIIRVLELIAKHNWHVDIGKKIEGRKVTMSFRHDLGPKFTVFLRAMTESTFKNEFHSNPTYEEGENSLTVHFSLP